MTIPLAVLAAPPSHGAVITRPHVYTPSLWLPSPNGWPGNPAWPKRIWVQHTESGHEAGTDAEFLDPASQLSANGSVDLGGVKRLFRQWRDAAWANGIVDNPAAWDLPGVIRGINMGYFTCSCETEDNGDPVNQVVTVPQYKGTLEQIWEAQDALGGTLVAMCGHYYIYSGHSCPGPRWRNTGALQQLAGDSGLRLYV